MKHHNKDSHLQPDKTHITSILPSSTIVLPIVKTTISAPNKPSTPAHIGELRNNPYYAKWKEALFKNYKKC
jgi:hypothetical protein